MPLANIFVLEGHPRPVLKQLLREFSRAYARLLDAPIERLQVWIEEIDPELYAISGEPADEVLAERDRASSEIPLIRLALMDGRPQEQIEAAIRELSELVADVLGGSSERVRVEVRKVQPEHWGIGGVPASIKRRAELEARGVG